MRTRYVFLQGCDRKCIEPFGHPPKRGIYQLFLTLNTPHIAPLRVRLFNFELRKSYGSNKYDAGLQKCGAILV